MFDIVIGRVRRGSFTWVVQVLEGVGKMVNFLKKRSEVFEGGDDSVEGGWGETLFSELLEMVLEVMGLELVN